MNWDAISAIGEILGAIAVVATLLFVAREVRQNNRALAVSVLRDTTAQWNHWSDMMATSPDLAEIVARGNIDFHSLGVAEGLRYGAYVQSFVDNVESYRALVLEHQIQKDMDVLVSIAGRKINIPGFRAWWQENTGDYDPEFIAWLDGLIEPGS